MSRRRGEGSEHIRARVRKARELQQQRFNGTGIRTNAEMNCEAMDECCTLADDARAMLRLAISDLNLSARAYDRILRVSRTIADLDGKPTVGSMHITEAIQYRTLDRELW